MSDIGDIRVGYNTRGIPHYEVHVQHSELNQYQVIRGNDKYVVVQKARAKADQWDKRWQRESVNRNRRVTREKGLALASEMSDEARAKLAALDNILAHTLTINDAIDWYSLLSREPFAEYPPLRPRVPTRPNSPQLPPEPKKNDLKYIVKPRFWDNFSSSRREKRQNAVDETFKQDHADWRGYVQAVQAEYDANISTWQIEVQRLQQEFDRDIAEWARRKEQYQAEQDATNAAIAQKKELYEQADPAAVVDYCEIVLNNSQYPEGFTQSFELEYKAEGKSLVVDYEMPTLEDIPDVKEYRYVASREEIVPQKVSEAQRNRTYDAVLYQIALRTIHELFEADVINAIDIVTFNGMVRTIDPSTGQPINPCILTVQSNRTEFLAINLAAVEPKSCFKRLKGVAAARLHTVTPVAPIVKLEREDVRFVSSYAVADTLDEGENLAAMDWEDFEHLIRELFEKEFSREGCEVKVTRASRDGGIDAVVFDPDPLRGGKIVIQAKRYTNTVGVAAVRDLYGTLINEGANKGILVTTATYGPDAYEFAKGKPISLLDGGNLLHLLQQHGYRARIDLKAAKEAK